MFPRLAVLFTTLTVALSLGCKKKAPDEPPPDPNHVVSCSVEEAQVSGDQLRLGKINVSGRERTTLNVPGTLSVEVVHKTGTFDESGKKVCGGTGAITLASYDANKFYSHTTVKLEGKCAPPPSGSVLAVKTWFLRDGEKDRVGCSFIPDIPAGLGGTGLSTSQQQAKVDWERAAREKPALAKPMLDYVATLPKVVAAVGDPKSAHKTTSCGAQVSGPATLFPYRVLRRVASTAPGGPTNIDVDEPMTVSGGRFGEKFAFELEKSMTSSPYEYVVDIQRLERMGPTMASQPKWLVVVTTRRYTMPNIEESATRDKKGAYTAGSFEGDVVIVDRTNGAVGCASPFTATSHGETSNPGDDFLGAIVAMAWRTAHKIAPGLKE